MWASLALSVVLTVVLNLAVRIWPDRARRGAARLGAVLDRPGPSPDADRPRVRVVVPWKAMLVASLALTVLFNLLLRTG
jgi:hypothetical protein